MPAAGEGDGRGPRGGVAVGSGFAATATTVRRDWLPCGCGLPCPRGGFIFYKYSEYCEIFGGWIGVRVWCVFLPCHESCRCESIGRAAGDGRRATNPTLAYDRGNPKPRGGGQGAGSPPPARWEVSGPRRPLSPGSIFVSRAAFVWAIFGPPGGRARSHRMGAFFTRASQHEASLPLPTFRSVPWNESPPTQMPRGAPPETHPARGIGPTAPRPLSATKMAAILYTSQCPVRMVFITHGLNPSAEHRRIFTGIIFFGSDGTWFGFGYAHRSSLTTLH